MLIIALALQVNCMSLINKEILLSFCRYCIDFLPSFAADRVGEEQRGGPQTWAKNAVSETATESRGYGD